MKVKVAAIFLGLFLIVGFIFTSAVSADDSTVSAEPTSSPKPFLFFNRTPVTEGSESAKPSGSPSLFTGNPRVKGIDRLTNIRLKFCQNHEDEIKTRVTSLNKLVVGMIATFDAIAARVEDFYTNKVIPSGKTVPNYKELTDAITAKKAAVTTAMTNAQNDVSTFNCTSDNPKGELNLFRTDMQAVKKALQDYRTSIKNLIVAVKSVTGETNSSPKPTEASSSATEK